MNADALGGNVGALLSHNTFAYCNNDPVNAKDPNGFRPQYTQGEETDAMRKASYKAMNKFAKAQSKRVSPITTTKTSSGYTRHVNNAEIASTTCIYGPTGGYVKTQINTPDLPVQAYLGGAASVGIVWNGDGKWNIYEIGLNIAPIKTGGTVKVDIGIFHCEIQVGAAVGLEVTLTAGGYSDNSGFGVILGAGASWFPGAEATFKVWVEH